MSKNDNLIFNKYKFSLLILLFGILINKPLVFLIDFFNEELRLVIMLVVSIFVLIYTKIINNKKSFKYLIILVFIFLCYFFSGVGYITYLIVQLVNLFFMLTIYLFVNSKINANYIVSKFINISVFISILTLIAFIGISTDTIPFPSKEIAGYDVNFNYLFGSVQKKLSLFQPHYYFLEPSYYGFFLGFSFLYLFQLKQIKFQFLKLIPILISGLILFSFTFYTALVIGLISFLIYKISNPFLNSRHLSKLFLVSFVFLSLISYEYTDRAKETIFIASSSFYNRIQRINLSLETIKTMNATEKLFGKGTGHIISDDFRDLKESNSYLKVFIENGAVVLLFWLLIIYFILRDNPPLLMFVLVSLHAVVLLETPFFILLLSLVSVLPNNKLFNQQIIKNGY